MSKHEKSFNEDPIDPDLLRRTETAILAYMAENDGKMPTQQKVNETVRTSYNRLGPAWRSVRDRLLATQTRLANMPEIPEDLRLLHVQMLKDLWARTRDLQNGEIVDLRRAQAAKDESHREDMTESQTIIALVETDRDQEKLRADAAEAECTELREVLKTATMELAAANARLAERDAIFAMLALQRNTEVEADDAKPRKGAQTLPASDDPETGDLPMSAPKNRG